MKIKICDKCGADIHEAPEFMNAVLPRYTIYKNSGIVCAQEIDLCPACERRFEEWMAKWTDEEVRAETQE